MPIEEGPHDARTQPLPDTIKGVEERGQAELESLRGKGPMRDRLLKAPRRLKASRRRDYSGQLRCL